MKLKTKLKKPYWQSNFKIKEIGHAQSPYFFTMNHPLRTFLFLIFSIAIIACNQQEAPAEGVQANSEQQVPEKTGNQYLDSLNQAIATDPSDVNAYVARARFRMERGDMRNALFDIQEAQRIDSLAAPVMQTLGEYRMAENRSREAKNAWLKCARFDAQNAACRLSLAKLFYTVQDYDAALKWVDEAIDRDRYNAEAYFYKGLIFRNKLQDTALAMQFAQQAIELQQDYVEALDFMGVMLTAKNDTLAPYYFQRALEHEPRRDDIYYKLGVYYMNQDEVNKAIENYTEATRLNPQNSDAFYNLGFIFIQLKEYQDARDYFSKSIAARPNYKAHYGRGYAHEMLGDIINAEKDYKKALELLPMYKPASEALNRIKK